MRGFNRRRYLALYTKAEILSQFLKNDLWITKAVEYRVEITKNTLA